FAQASTRRVKLRESHGVRDSLFVNAVVVVLFAYYAFEEIAATHSAVGLDRIQLHGAEDDDFAVRVEREIGLPVLRAVPVATVNDAKAADHRKGSALLFDAAPPNNDAQTGGHGVAFDWSALQGYGGERNFLLAGGLTPDNVGEAVNIASEHAAFVGVDVSSGVEKERGVKDTDLIQAFADAARAALE
ncbi:MAG: phosphoribosylanthranilate isomerase, partial [Pseudomonadota bacterium]